MHKFAVKLILLNVLASLVRTSEGGSYISYGDHNWSPMWSLGEWGRNNGRQPKWPPTGSRKVRCQQNSESLPLLLASYLGVAGARVTMAAQENRIFTKHLSL